MYGLSASVPLLVAGGAIHQPLSLLWVLVPVAVFEAEAHVDPIGASGHGHLADVTVAVLAVPARGKVGPVIKVDEIGQIHDAWPLQRATFRPHLQNRVHRGLAALADDLYVLVAANAFLHGGDAGHWAVDRARMTEQAWYIGGDVLSVVESDGGLRLCLRSGLCFRSGLQAKGQGKAGYNHQR